MPLSQPLRASLLSIFAISALTLATAASAAVPSKLVVFGDSLSDVGNTAARFATIGRTLPGDPYYQGRFSNGLLSVEVMANTMGVALEDYGYGGAKTGTDNRITAAGPLLANTGVQGQISTYLSQQTQPLDANALYLVWAGGNDFFDAPVPATVFSASQNLAHDVSMLYAAGARNFFIPTLPDLQYTADSIARGPTVQAGAHYLSVSFNGALAQAMGQVQAVSPGAHIQMFEVNTVLTAVRNGYIAQGGNVTDPCWTGSYYGSADTTGVGTQCSNPGAYYLWDSVHPSATVHNYVGKAFAAAAVPEPESYALALGGLLIVGGMRARQRRQGR